MSNRARAQSWQRPARRNGVLWRGLKGGGVVQPRGFVQGGIVLLRCLFGGEVWGCKVWRSRVLGYLCLFFVFCLGVGLWEISGVFGWEEGGGQRYCC